MSVLKAVRCIFSNPCRLVFLLVLSFNCFAESNTTTTTYTFKELGWDNSVTLNGYKPNFQFYLPIDSASHPQKAVLHLKLAFSPSLAPETQIEISFNQTFLRRITVPADLNQEVSLDIELPLTQLSAYWQALHFSAKLASTKSLCYPENWIYISPESSFTLTRLELPFNGTLNQLSTLFFRGPNRTLLLLLPQNPATQEMLSLFRIALHIGQITENSSMRLQAGFINASEAKQKENDVIVVGRQANLSKYPALNPLSTNQAVSDALKTNAGIILLNPSPFNTLRGLLTFTGKDDVALHKAVSAFLTPEFMKMASGREAIIDTVKLPLSVKSNGNWFQSSLQQLGFADQSVSGLGRHQLNYAIALPNDRTPVNASIKTFITAPPFTQNDHSQITLLMNGLKQSSFRLTAPHSVWEVQIDSSAMKPGINTVQYVIDLHLEKEQCSRENYDEVWATIHAQTEFNTSFLNTYPKALLNQFPVPFAKEVTVVVPNQLSKQDITNLTQLAFTFGQLIQPNPFPFHFMTSAEVNEAFIRNQNIILYGNATNNPWIAFANEYLPMQLKEGVRFFNNQQKQLQLKGTEGSSTGLLELVPSPWSEGHSVMLIAGDNDAARVAAVMQLTDNKVRMGLNGTIALMNADGSVALLQSDDIRYFTFKNRVIRWMTTFGKNTLYYVKNNPQVWIYLLVLFVTLFIFVRQRRK